MNDDWRLRIEIADDRGPRGVRERLEAADLEHGLDSAFHERVIVSEDGPEIFCYAGTRDQADRAEELIRTLAAERGWEIHTELRHWHPDAEEWEDPDQPLPSSSAEEAAERAEVIDRERRESAAAGYPEFEVRVQCRTHHDAIVFAEKLNREGVPSVRRWHYLLVGAADEDAASSLAEKIRSEAPPGTIVTSEGSGRAIWALRPGNPFAIFGGLGT